MTVPSQLYRPPLGLLTDFYEITMAYAAWKEGIVGREASFTVTFRRNPFDGGFTVAAGLADVVDLIANWRLGEEDLAFLASMEDPSAPAGAAGVPRGVRGTVPKVFEPGFIEMLRALSLHLDLDAVPEGTVVFPHEPLLRISGPVVPGMLLESAILAIVNFQSLVATKAARICLAAAGEPVIEFGMRRAQGIDGGLSAARAAFIGGCDATSNTLAGRLYGIPVRGTHAHSWVMLHESEREAFQAYAEALPSNCVFLVDTYATLDGVAHAIDAARWLRSQGREIVGIRLDSGDLAWLSQQARKMLDAAGFPKAAILASNELDEHVIQSLRDQNAAIAVWGVGTRLVTGHPEGALGGVYKLGAVRSVPGTRWEPRLKISEAIDKTSVPGIVQVRRFASGSEAFSDAIWEEGLGIPSRCVIVDPSDPTRRREIPEGMGFEDLLVPIFRRGKRVYDPPPLERVRQHAKDQLARFHAGVKRFLNPHRFPVGLERQLHDLRTRLVLDARRVPA
jgi:nicotinate phosphoribosyltransferase